MRSPLSSALRTHRSDERSSSGRDRLLRLTLGLVTAVVFLLALVAWSGIRSPEDFADRIPGRGGVLRAAELFEVPAGAEAAPPPLDAIGRPVVLPFREDDARGVTQVFRIRVDVASDSPQTPQGICLLNASAEAAVWIDGQPLRGAPAGSLALRAASDAHFVALPPGLSPGTHLVDLRVATPAGLPPGIGEIWSGDGDLVRHACDAANDRRQMLRIGSFHLVALIGLVALGIAFLQRDAAAAWFAAMAVAWIAHYAVNNIASPTVDGTTWALLFYLTRPLAGLPLVMFCIKFTQARRPWIEHGVIAMYVVAYLALAALPPEAWPKWVTAFGLALLCVLGPVFGWLLHFSLGRAGFGGLGLSVGMFFGIATNVLDLMRWVGLVPYGVRLAGYMTVPLLALAIVALLVERLALYMRDEATASERMRLELERQRAQLAEDHAMLQSQRERIAVLEERRRIMRDMHDGLGTQLVSASALLRSEGHTDPTLKELVDHALQEFRIVLDVLSSPAANPGEDESLQVSLLLGKLRHRLEPALRARGIGIEWDVDALPANFLIHDQDKLQLLRLVQEGFANVLKHSGATRVRFLAYALRDRILIELMDNGRGIDPTVADEGNDTGHGIPSMRARAEVLGGKLEIENAAPGTRVRVTFPRAPRSRAAQDGPLSASPAA